MQEDQETGSVADNIWRGDGSEMTVKKKLAAANPAKDLQPGLAPFNFNHIRLIMSHS